MNYNKILELASKSFDAFRRWFNANFKLVINYRYAGLGRITVDMFIPFLRRLGSALDRRSYRGGVIKFKLGHEKISVYPY